MSKHLYLIRHAKSSWKDSGTGDHDRPLNKRGKNDAPFMANVLKEQGVRPDIILSSTAKRALATAEAFAEVFGIKKKDIEKSDSLYMAWQDDFMKCIKSISDRHKTAFIFSHNPGITDFANALCNTNILNIPTCGIFQAEIKAKSWKDTELRKARFVSFDFPKNHIRTE